MATGSVILWLQTALCLLYVQFFNVFKYNLNIVIQVFLFNWFYLIVLIQMVLLKCFIEMFY